MSLSSSASPASLALVLALAMAACTSTPPAPAHPAVAERARAAGLITEAARAEADRDAAALARRAPRMAYPILVPSDPGAFELDGATVDDDGESVYYALRYRRPDGTCFTVAGGDDESRRQRGGGARDSVEVEVRALHEAAVIYRVGGAPGESPGRGLQPGDLISRPIDADGLGITFSSVADDDRECSPVSLDDAAALVAGLRPLDPADDLPGAYRPIDLAGLAGPIEGDDSEAVARLAFAPAGSAGDVVVQTVRRTDARAVVLVTRRGTGEGAVRDEEIRAVFVHRDDGGWRLVSAGARVRCQPGRGHEDWSPEPCG